MTARLAHVKAPGDRFRCEPYRGAMTGENCIRRQAMARAGDERFGKCRRCKDGRRVERQVTGRAAEWTPCAAEGCRLAASPIHESGLCLTHARERKAKEETMTDLCERPGCVRPRAKSPGTIEGGKALCKEHRGALARAAKKAAEAKAPAPLTVPDTEPMAVPIEATPAPIAEAQTVTRDPMLASIVPIADAADSASRDAKAAKVVAELTIPDPAAVRAITDALNEMARRLRVYVAAAKTLVVHARAAADELRLDERICVGSRWHDILEEGAGDPLDYAALKRILSDNLDDLRSCDVVLALTCRDAGRGVYGEIGRALEMGKLVVWSLQRGGRCQDLADERVIEAPTDAQAIQIVRTLAAWREAA